MVEEKSKYLTTTVLHVLTLVQMRDKRSKCRLWHQTCFTLTLRRAEITEDAQQRLQDATRLTICLHTRDVTIYMTFEHLWILPYVRYNSATCYSQI